MSFGMILLVCGIAGVAGTLGWIVFDKSKAKAREDQLVYQALEKSYGSDTEKLKEVHTAVKLSTVSSTGRSFAVSRMNTAPTETVTLDSEEKKTVLDDKTEIVATETEILTEKIDS